MGTSISKAIGFVFRPLFGFLALTGLAGTAAGDAVVGQPAPPFELQGSDGNTYSLEGLLAKKTAGIVLAFFPKAFTPG